MTKAWSAMPGYLVTNPDEVSAERIGSDIPLIQKAGCCKVATNGDKVTGYALLKPMELVAISHVFRLNIVVDPESVGGGVGTALLNSLLTWARGDPAVRKIELLVRSTNERAIRLYKKFGFVEEGRFKDRVRTKDGGYIDDISMRLLFDK